MFKKIEIGEHFLNTVGVEMKVLDINYTDGWIHFINTSNNFESVMNITYFKKLYFKKEIN